VGGRQIDVGQRGDSSGSGFLRRRGISMFVKLPVIRVPARPILIKRAKIREGG